MSIKSELTEIIDELKNPIPLTEYGFKIFIQKCEILRDRIPTDLE